MLSKNTEQLNRELEMILGGENEPIASQTQHNIEQPIPKIEPSMTSQPSPQNTAMQNTAPIAQITKLNNEFTKPNMLKEAEKTTAPPAPKLQALPNPSLNSSVSSNKIEPTSNFEANREPQMRISKSSWDKYHEAWRDYYKKYYTELAQKNGTSKQDFEDKMKQEIQDEAIKNQPSFFKKLFSRKVLPFVIGILAILILSFLQYNRNIIGFFATLLAPSHGDIALAEIPDLSAGMAISAEPKLYIPKINVAVPIVFGAASDTDSQNRAMENGVAQFSIPGANALPGQVGNLAIAGHSSNDLFDRGDYKFIFARLSRLEIGDTIFLDYGGTRYTYRIVRTEEVQPTESNRLTTPTDRPMLTLITCTPVGTALRRLMVFAEQISPAPTIAEQPTVSKDSNVKMPANSPTLFERIQALFTL